MKPPAGKPKRQFAFIQVSDPSKKETDSCWKKQVRSHAARNSRARQERVAAYQAKATQPTTPAANRHSESMIIESGTTSQHNLNSVPSVTLSSTHGSPITPLSAARKDPFSSFARPVSPYESFLLDHFVHYVVMNAISCFPFMTSKDEIVFRHGMMTHWVQMAATDPGMLASLFLVACRNLATIQTPKKYESLALKYKNECLRMLSLAIETEGSSISDTTISKALALASDAATTGDHETSLQHFRAARQMVHLRGGPNTFSTRGFVGRVVIWFIKDPLQGRNSIVEPFCLSSKVSSV